jgi:hypothetical protein
MEWVLLYLLPNGQLPNEPLQLYHTQQACIRQAKSIEEHRMLRTDGAALTAAQLTYERLQAAVFNLQHRGEISDELAMMQRFGVPYLTQAGHLRELRAIVDDATRAIGRQQSMTIDERRQLALAFGFVGELARAIAGGPESVQRLRNGERTAMCVSGIIQP